MAKREKIEGADHPERMNGSFFGRRKTKPIRAQQQQRMEKLLPKLLLDPEQPKPANCSELFAVPTKSYVLEIGFGAGEHLVQRASENPDIGFIGCEPFINGMAMGVAAIDRAGLKNIRLFDEDATRLFDWLPAQAFNIIYLLYPDPWPKRRHWKRRFVSSDNLDAIANLLKIGGEFRFASDIAHYVNWTLQHCDANPSFDWLAQSAEHWHQPWDGWRSTRYEKKAIREGRQSAYLTFQRAR